MTISVLENFVSNSIICSSCLCAVDLHAPCYHCWIAPAVCVLYTPAVITAAILQLSVCCTHLMLSLLPFSSCLCAVYTPCYDCWPAPVVCVLYTPRVIPANLHTPCYDCWPVPGIYVLYTPRVITAAVPQLSVCCTHLLLSLLPCCSCLCAVHTFCYHC